MIELKKKWRKINVCEGGSGKKEILVKLNGELRVVEWKMAQQEKSNEFY